MNSNRDLQYLVDGTDGFLYIVHQKSIVVDEKYKKIEVGIKIFFLWPEDAMRQKKFEGTILEVSKSECVLKTTMTEMCKERNKHSKRSSETSADEPISKRVKRTALIDDNLPQKKIKSPNISIQERKRAATTLEAKKIIDEIKLKSFPDLPGTSNEPEFVTESYPVPETLASKINSTLKIAQTLVETLQSVLTELSSVEIESTLPLPKAKNITTVDIDNFTLQPSSYSLPSPNCTGLSLSQLSPLSSQSTCYRRSTTALNYSFSNDSTPFSSPLTQRISNVEYCPSPVQSYFDAKKIPTSPRNAAKSLRLVSYDSNESEENDEKTLQKSKDKDSEHSDNKVTENINEEKNSTWTLRHIGSDDSGKIRELIKSSKVYVRKSALANAVRGARTQTALARMLLEEVFSKDALLRCSLTGGVAKGRGKNEDKEKKPGLDKDAIDALLDYVRKHAKANNWPAVDDRTVKTSLRSKLTELRKQRDLNKN